MTATLQSARNVSTITWSSSNPKTGFNAATDVDHLSVDVSVPISASGGTHQYMLEGTLAPGASVSLNLSGITEEAFNQNLNPTRFYSMVFSGSGASWRWEPDTVGGFGGFLSNPGSISGADGEGFSFNGKTALTISGSAKNVKITNTSGSGTLTYKFSMALGA